MSRDALDSLFKELKEISLGSLVEDMVKYERFFTGSYWDSTVKIATRIHSSGCLGGFEDDIHAEATRLMRYDGFLEKLSLHLYDLYREEYEETLEQYLKKIEKKKRIEKNLEKILGENKKLYEKFKSLKEERDFILKEILKNEEKLKGIKNILFIKCFVSKHNDYDNKIKSRDINNFIEEHYNNFEFTEKIKEKVVTKIKKEISELQNELEGINKEIEKIEKEFKGINNENI